MRAAWLLSQAAAPRQGSLPLWGVNGVATALSVPDRTPCLAAALIASWQTTYLILGGMLFTQQLSSSDICSEMTMLP